MKHQNQTSRRYYNIFTALSVGFIVSLVAFLDWPLLAKVPVGISLFIQLNTISHLLFNRWFNQDASTILAVVDEIR